MTLCLERRKLRTLAEQMSESERERAAPRRMVRSTAPARLTSIDRAKGMSAGVDRLML